MQKGNSNEYSVNPDIYLKSRPDYGKNIFSFLESIVADNNLAWDCATGNGQAANYLSRFFKQVIATDINQEQLDHAVFKDNINYVKSDEENPFLESSSVDLITVATAIHWLDRDKFYREVRRVLKPEGILAIWGYTGKNIHHDLDPVLDDIINKHLMPYYSQSIKMAFNGYKELEFPFEKIQTPAFSTHAEYEFNDLLNYILSWSSTQSYILKNKVSPVPLFENELREAWGDLSQKKTMRWNLITFVGKL